MCKCRQRGQPRPQGLSLKRPKHFLRERPWGRGWQRGELVISTFKVIMILHVYLIMVKDLSFWGY